MQALTTATLFSAATWLVVQADANGSIVQEWTPIGVLFAILLWFMRRADRATDDDREDRRREQRLRDLEAKAQLRLAGALEQLSRVLGESDSRGPRGPSPPAAG